MKSRDWKVLLWLTCFLLSPTVLFGQIQSQLKWEELPPIPDEEGFAGMFVGVSNRALIAMGGTNFPERLPGEGGNKLWYDNIFILEDETSSWKIDDKKLPKPLAHGVSFSYENNIILVGGSDAENHYSDVYSVSYNRGNISIDTLTPLPYPLANMTGALVGDILFIAGGTTSPTESPGNFFLAFNIMDQQWVELDPWPGPGRIFGVSASLHDKFFLFSGINTLESPDGSIGRTMLRDGYKFIPSFQNNRVVGGEWKVLSEPPRSVAAGPSPAPTVGLDHILFPGGLDAPTARQAEIDPASFSGFTTDLLAYHVESDSWLSFGNLPENSTRVTVPSARWNNKWVIPSGEKGPGVRAPQVYALSKPDLKFGWGNWLAVMFYMGILVWLGYEFSKRGNTTADYFKADGRVPWWAAGISIYGTQMSAITFMAIPAIVFVTDWSLAIGSLMILAIVPILIKYYLPFFRRLNITSAYEYFGYRFNDNVRLLGSASFILLVSVEGLKPCTFSAEL